MARYIDLDAVLAEIEKRIRACGNCYILDELTSLHRTFDSLEGKEVEEYKQPEYSCLKTVYWCGKKPHWNIGDMLAYYEFDSDIEGECILGKVINVELDEEQHDWLYTFEDGSVYDEQSLLEDQTYKKN